MRHEDPRERVRAAKEVGRVGGRAAEAALAGALGDAAESVRQAAATALAKLDPRHRGARRVLMDGLGSADWYTRWQACLALRGMGPPAAEAVPLLLNLAFDKEKDVVQEAALALGAIAPESPDVLDAFERLLASDLAVDRRPILQRLDEAGRLGKVRAWLAEEFLTGAHRMREAAFDALLALGTEGAASFVPCLKAPDARVRALAAAGIGELRWTEGVGALAAAADDPVPEVRVGVLDALRQLGADAAKALPRMLAALEDGETAVRNAALDAIGAVGKESRDEATPPVLRALRRVEDEKELLRAKRTLERIGSGNLARVLGGRVLEERQQDGSVLRRHVVFLDLAPAREGAGEPLGALLMELKQNAYGPPALAALREVLDPDATEEALLASLRADLAWERQVAAFLLGHLGRDAAKAKAALQAATRDPDGDVREEAKSALEELGR